MHQTTLTAGPPQHVCKCPHLCAQPIRSSHSWQLARRGDARWRSGKEGLFSKSWALLSLGDMQEQTVMVHMLAVWWISSSSLARLSFELQVSTNKWHTTALRFTCLSLCCSCTCSSSLFWYAFCFSLFWSGDNSEANRSMLFDRCAAPQRVRRAQDCEPSPPGLGCVLARVPPP
jgi:hypothetical protein